MVLVAGSRHLEVDGRTCRDLLEGLQLAGFHFFVGCARGLDKSFWRPWRKAPFAKRVLWPAPFKAGLCASGREGCTPSWCAARAGFGSSPAPPHVVDGKALLIGSPIPRKSFQRGMGSGLASGVPFGHVSLKAGVRGIVHRAARLGALPGGGERSFRCGAGLLGRPAPFGRRGAVR